MHFPLFVELEGRPCLIVGGGRVAARKAAALAGFGAAVSVVAPEICEELESRLDGVRLRRRPFCEADVEGQTLVVAATDDPELNGRVAACCRVGNIPVNVVDDPKNCTFVFPALVRKGPLVAAVSSGGAAPVAAKLVRDKVSALLSDDFVTAVERLGAERDDLKRRFPDMEDRRRYCEEVLKKWKD